PTISVFRLDRQFKEKNITPSAVVVPSGSSYTHTGLLTGLRLSDNHVPVIGACVRRNAEQQNARVYQCSQNLCNNLLETPNVVSKSDIQLEDFCLDGGYGNVTNLTKNAIELLAQKEGLLSDPVYSAKAFSCLFGLIEKGHFSKGDDIVIIHTGGTPALFAYYKLF
ncbi:MAG: pyridoxal-phosphate dependent enzyme, partial [SAR324 cluster bacterium]|nr:pyridoxal-phosphate dependent enzyme [SAR324 cluster bacterium]